MDSPTLGEDAVRAWVDAGTWSRSEAYLHGEKVFATRRQGETLKARVEGSGVAPYHTRITLAAAGTIAAAHCTCAVGGDGRCKHVAALARTWLARPGDFLAIDPLGVALRKRTRPELEALITRMLERDPSLETLLETALPGQRAGVVTATQIPVYRRQAEEVFREHGEGFAAVVPIAEGLRPLVEIGDGFVTAGEVAHAAQTYDEIVQSVLDRYATYAPHDGHGHLRAVVAACVRGLGRCLALESVPREARRRALRALVDALDADDFGTTGAVPDLILEHALPDERALVASWLRALGDDDATEVTETPWDRLRHGQLLFDLVVDELPEESFARACRSLHRWAQLAEHLLLFGRTDEALAVAREAELAALPAVAEVLARHGCADAAERILATRAEREPAAEVFTWLLHRARHHVDAATLRRWTEGLLLVDAQLERFLALRAMTPPEAWPAVRARVFASPAVRARRGVYVQMLLAEGETDAALTEVQDEATVDSPPTASGLRLRVAEVVASQRPAAAIAIWQKHIDDLIATGQRPRYREAAAYVREVMNALDAQGERGAAWLEALHHRHPRRRALREELARFGL